MKIKIIHIDDEPRILEDTFNILKEMDSIEYVAGFTSFQEANNHILKADPDVLLCDIELDNTDNIFDFLSTLNNRIQIIFLTGHDKYAIDSYKIKATDYLLKPVIAEELQAALDLVRRNLILNNVLSVSDMLVNYTQTPSMLPKRVKIVTAGKVFIELYSDIEFLKADGNYTNIHKTDGSIIVTGKNLKIYKEMMLNHTDFVDISRSTLINRQHLAGIIREKYKIFAEMKSGIKLEISLLRKDEILERLDNF